MANKSISLPEEVYSALKKEKRKGESIPELINRLLMEKKEKEMYLEDVAGSLEEDDEWDEILEDIYRDRERLARKCVV